MNSKAILCLMGGSTMIASCLGEPAANETESSNEGQSQAPKNQSNIIYILADDLGYGDLSCYGQKLFETPNIDRLAKEGMMFTRHYSGSTVSAPSRCCLMTGMHTGHSTIRGNKGVNPHSDWPLRDEDLTMAELLKGQGYATAAFGKWGMGGPENEGRPQNQGFDQFFGYYRQGRAHGYYPEYLWKNSQKVEYPENKDGAEGTYSHDEIMGRAMNFIRGNHDKPFFLYLPVTIPHADLDVPEPYIEKYKGKFPESPYLNPEGYGYKHQHTPKAAFAGMIEKLDEDVGRVLALLDSLGIAENTVVVFTSDNGAHVEGGADPGFFNSTAGLRGHKRDLYEGGIRVPMLVRWPAVVKAGSENDHVSAFWDILPTFCEISGAEVPGNIDGISFVPILEGQAGNQEKHTYLYWEFHEQKGKAALLTGDGKWKLVQLNLINPGEEITELYNIAEDPAEENNLARSHPEKVEELMQMLEKAHLPSKAFPWPSDPDWQAENH